MDDITSAMMGAVECFQPLYDAAEGQRAELERRGWSPTAAEAVAQQMLQGWITLVFTNGGTS